MNSERMYQEWLRRLSGLGDHLEKDEAFSLYLQPAYEFTIPDYNAGYLVEGEWELTCVPGQQDYVQPEWVYGIRDGTPRLEINGWPLRQYGDWQMFWTRYMRNSTQQGQPEGVLVYQQTITVRYIPDSDYKITFQTRNYPRDWINADSTPPTGYRHLDGVENYAHAKAVIAAGVYEYALETRQKDVIESAGKDFDAKMARIRMRSLTRPRPRRERRTF